MSIVIHGSPVDGLSLTGPFEDCEQATNWAESRLGSEWWVVELERPEGVASQPAEPERHGDLSELQEVLRTIDYADVDELIATLGSMTDGIIGHPVDAANAVVMARNFSTEDIEKAIADKRATSPLEMSGQPIPTMLAASFSERDLENALAISSAWDRLGPTDSVTEQRDQEKERKACRAWEGE